jgi:hypothetical protein
MTSRVTFAGRKRSNNCFKWERGNLLNASKFYQPCHNNIFAALYRQTRTIFSEQRSLKFNDHWKIVVYLTSSCVNWTFFLTSGPLLNASETSVLKAHECQKKAEFNHEQYNVFLFDEPLKGSKSLKIFKISLTFRFDKL